MEAYEKVSYCFATYNCLIKVAAGDHCNVFAVMFWTGKMPLSLSRLVVAFQNWLSHADCTFTHLLFVCHHSNAGLLLLWLGQYISSFQRGSEIVFRHYQRHPALFHWYLDKYQCYEADCCCVGSVIKFYIGIHPAIFRIQLSRNVEKKNSAFWKTPVGWMECQRIKSFQNPTIYHGFSACLGWSHLMVDPTISWGAVETFHFGTFLESHHHAIVYISASGDIQKLGIQFSEPPHPN